MVWTRWSGTVKYIRRRMLKLEPAGQDRGKPKRKFVKFVCVTEDAGDGFRYCIYSLNLPNSKSVFKATWQTWVTSQNLKIKWRGKKKAKPSGEQLLQQSREDIVEPLVNMFSLCCCSEAEGSLLQTAPVRCSVPSSSEQQQEVHTAVEQISSSPPALLLLLLLMIRFPPAHL